LSRGYILVWSNYLAGAGAADSPADSPSGAKHMSVRKRIWQNQDGSQGEAWIVAYTDQSGKRHIKSFERKKDADTFHAAVDVDIRHGIHVPDSQSIVVAEAAKLWLASCEDAGLERTTLAGYKQHAALHVIPLLGAIKLSQLTVPMVRAFEDSLRKNRSAAMVRKIRCSLGSILADAQERGLVGQNVVRSLRRHKESRRDKRQGKLKIGVDIPSPDEIRKIIVTLGRWRPLFLTAIFTGLRASELRGLRWIDVDLNRGKLHVRQRADRFNIIGRLKSEESERTIPLPPIVINTLREHRLACPKGELGLVFPNGKGNVENYSNITKRGLFPALIAAGVVNADGRPKYTGLHALRHFYASWCINRRVDGGLELPLKLIQARLGHASIQMTADRYGHLFPRGDDGAELAAAEKAFLGANR
jgi:integrase